MAKWLTNYFIVQTLQILVHSSDTQDIESPGMNILRHVGVFPFLALLIPPHHYQQCGEGEGKGEHGNFHLSFIKIKSPGNSPPGLEILTLLSVVTSAFWMRIVENTLRIPANRDFLETIFTSQISDHINCVQTYPENAKAAQETQAMERMVLYPHSPW